MTVHTLESCIDLLDNRIINSFVQSINRRIKIHNSLTQKQINRIQRVIIEYNDKLTGVPNLLDIVNTHSIKILKIDYSKWIKRENDRIIVRFSFNKSDYVKLTKHIQINTRLPCKDDRYEYHFEYNEQNVLNLVTAFNNTTTFNIDSDILDDYYLIVNILNNKYQYISYIKDLELINTPEQVKQLLYEEFGPLTSKSLLFYIDRRIKYSIDAIPNPPDNTLTTKIAYRAEPVYESKSSESYTDIVHSLIELNRIPCIVYIDKQYNVDNIQEIVETFSKYIPIDAQTAIYSKRSSKKEVNNIPNISLIHNYFNTINIKSTINSTTKVVYVINSKNKFPNELFDLVWKPIAGIILSTYNTTIPYLYRTYIRTHCDLIIDKSHNQLLSIMRRYNDL